MASTGAVGLVGVILPIVLLVGAGYFLARYAPIDLRTLSFLVIYLLTPCLVFTALVRADLSAETGFRLVGFVVAHLVLMLWLTLLASRMLRLGAVERSGMSLSTVFYNSGNYGLPVSLLAFGEEGFRLATIVFVVSAIALHSLGIYLASAGRNAPLRAVGDVFRIPLIYAAVLGLLFAHTGWTIPGAIWTPLQMLGQGAIPLLIVTLGVQLAKARPSSMTLPLGTAVALRLGISPLTAALLLPLFGVTGLAASVAVVLAAMPTMINSFIIASRFDAAPEFVASAVFSTTVASFASVSLVLLLVR